MSDELPVIIYPDDFDPKWDAEIEEIRMKGYFSHARVAIGDEEYVVCFSDITRLQQDFKFAVAKGELVYTAVGLIIIEEVTPEMMERAVLYLWERGYFDHFVSVKGKVIYNFSYGMVGYANINQLGCNQMQNENDQSDLDRSE